MYGVHWKRKRRGDRLGEQSEWWVEAVKRVGEERRREVCDGGEVEKK